MIIEKILSQRFSNHEYYWQTVFEWENVLSEYLGKSLSADYRPRNLLMYVLRKRIPFIANLTTTQKTALRFEMNPRDERGDYGYNKKNVVPWIIDFFIDSREKLDDFYKFYAHNKVVLISSREVYEKLLADHCPLNIQHLGLSLSDRWSLDASTINKHWDLVVLGRNSSVLMGFLERYLQRHPDFSYIRQEKIDGMFVCVTSKGEIVGSADSREEYMSLLRKGRIAFYSTPAVDSDRHDAKSFNQVTPRFLEYIAAGCHVIARYPKNADTDWYEMSSITPHCETYEQFEQMMDYARTHEVDMEKYSKYLEKHYTSVRAEELKKILEELP